MNDSRFKGTLVVIAGPTASGKTSVAINLAKRLKSSIISADSRQFYKEIPIGTAAPSESELSEIKHYMVGNLSIKDVYNVSKFETDVINLLDNELVDCDYVILAGGSGLYIDAVCKGIDTLPDVDIEIRENVKKLFQENGLESLQLKLKEVDEEYYTQVDLNNPMRLMRALEVCYQTGKKYSDLRLNKPVKRNFKIIKVGLSVPRDELVELINLRTERMIEDGWVDEARSVHKYKELNSLATVGYKELFDFFEGRINFEKAIEKIKTNTRRYAKRQMTWFRRDKEIKWFGNSDILGMLEYIKQSKKSD